MWMVSPLSLAVIYRRKIIKEKTNSTQNTNTPSFFFISILLHNIQMEMRILCSFPYSVQCNRTWSMVSPSENNANRICRENYFTREFVVDNVIHTKRIPSAILSMWPDEFRWGKNYYLLLAVNSAFHLLSHVRLAADQSFGRKRKLLLLSSSCRCDHSIKL